jgi:hypothetical protein
MINKFKYKPEIHDGQKVIFFQFEKDFKLAQELKTWIGRKYNTTEKCWFVPAVTFTEKNLESHLKKR